MAFDSLLLGDRTAEEIKRAIGSAYRTPDESDAEIRGRDLATGLPKNIVVSAEDIRKALLDADVNFKIAKEFTDSVKEKAIGAKVINAISPGQLMVKIVQDELTTLMGSEASLMDLSKSPTIILVAGLQGSGKTTFSGKLANYLKAQKIAFISSSRYLSTCRYGSTNLISISSRSGCFCRKRK